MRDKIYELLHVKIGKDEPYHIDRQDLGVKIVGLFSSRELAESIAARRRVEEGFCKWPDGFRLVERPLNRITWEDGFDPASEYADLGNGMQLVQRRGPYA